MIDVDEQRKLVKIYNYTLRDQYRAFGRVETPTFEEYEEFLESRCFPRSRDKMKVMLKELDMPFYDPLLIVEREVDRLPQEETIYPEEVKVRVKEIVMERRRKYRYLYEN